MTDASNGGLHNRIDFFQNISTPSLSGFVSALYPLSVSSVSELAYTNASGTTQITSGTNAIWKGGSGSGVVSSTIATNGSMSLPNGLIFKWGQSTSGSGTQNITFAVAFPTNCFNVQVTNTSTSPAGTASSVIYPVGFSRSGFTFRYGGSSINGFFWFAIGN